MYILQEPFPYNSAPQIDRLNLEGYANLEHWVADLDKRIETILLQRLTQIIQTWCTEFDRVDDGGFRRETAPRDATTIKRRGDKRLKEEKVCHALLPAHSFSLDIGLGRKLVPSPHCSRDQNTESSYLPRSSDRTCSRDMDQTVARMARYVNSNSRWIRRSCPHQVSFAAYAESRVHDTRSAFRCKELRQLRQRIHHLSVHFAPLLNID